VLLVFPAFGEELKWDDACRLRCWCLIILWKHKYRKDKHRNAVFGS